MINKIIIIASILLVTSCKTKVENPKTGKIKSTLMVKGVLYGAGEEGLKQENFVITTQSDWNDLLTKMNSVNKILDTSFSETEIDFSESNLIAVFDKVRGSGGVSLELDIKYGSDKIVVHINHVYPEGNATSIMTQPYYIVKIAKNGLPITFKETVIVK